MAERKWPETPFGSALRRIAKGKQLSSLQVPVLEDAADLIDELTEAREAAREASTPALRAHSPFHLDEQESFYCPRCGWLVSRSNATDPAPPAGETRLSRPKVISDLLAVDHTGVVANYIRRLEALVSALRADSGKGGTHQHEFGEVVGWGERAVRLCPCGQWELAAAREGLAALVEQCKLSEEAITGTLLARMQDVEAAQRTVTLKAAVQELAAWLAQEPGA